MARHLDFSVLCRRFHRRLARSEDHRDHRRGQESTSFGCSNDSDLTYFGEAFYRDALPGAKSLRDAFEAAKKAIAAREHREHETPSNPQAYFGAEIEAKLAAMGG